MPAIGNASNARIADAASPDAIACWTEAKARDHRCSRRDSRKSTSNDAECHAGMRVMPMSGGRGSDFGSDFDRKLNRPMVGFSLKARSSVLRHTVGRTSKTPATGPFPPRATLSGCMTRSPRLRLRDDGRRAIRRSPLRRRRQSMPAEVRLARPTTACRPRPGATPPRRRTARRSSRARATAAIAGAATRLFGPRIANVEPKLNWSSDFLHQANGDAFIEIGSRDEKSVRSG